MKHPDISIVVPTVNEENYLPKLLKSIYDSRCEYEYEVIVVDQKSDDGTVEVAKEFGVKILELTERSVSLAREHGTKHAKGSWIISTSADVIMPPHYIQKIVQPLTKDYVLSFGPLVPHTTSVLLTAASSFMNTWMWVSSHTPFIFCGGDNMAFKKTAFTRVGGYNTSLHTLEDIDLAKRMARVGKVKFNKEAWVYTSTRRLDKWGVVKFVSFHVQNYLKYHSTLSSKVGKEKYETVR